MSVVEWLIEHNAELALPTVTIAEIAYGIRNDERARRLIDGRMNGVGGSRIAYICDRVPPDAYRSWL